jgi:spore coat polysaccharide biosynthesis protein SpsF
MVHPISRLVVGAAQLGQHYGRSGKRAPDDPEVQGVLKLAASLKCAAIDTARSYGGSEAAIGRSRRAGSGTQLPIVTKIRPLTERDESTGVDAAVRASLAESLVQLGSERVETALLHRADDLSRANGAAIRALRAARDNGLLTTWGASVADPKELAGALAVPGLGYVQLPFNLVDRRWLAPEVHDAVAARPDVTIVARSIFLQGILLNPNVSTWPADTRPSATTVRSGLTGLAAETGRTWAGLCLGYVLAQPWIDAVVVGVRSAEQLAGVAMEFAREPLAAAECEQIVRLIPAGSSTLVNPALWPRQVKDRP